MWSTMVLFLHLSSPVPIYLYYFCLLVMVTWCADVMHWNMEGKSKPQPLLLISNAKLCNKSLIKRFKLTSGVPYCWFHTTLKYFHFWYRLAPALNSIYCIGSHFRSSSKALLLSCCCLVQNLVKCFITLSIQQPPKFLHVIAMPSSGNSRGFAKRDLFCLRPAGTVLGKLLSTFSWCIILLACSFQSFLPAVDFQPSG